MAATAAHYSPMTRIYLSGSLARKFFRFKDYQLDSGCAWEGFKALKNTVDGFAEEIARLGRLGLRFAIFRNRKNSGEDDWAKGGTREIRIVPVISGAKRAGILQTVLGVVLIAMSSITNGATLAPGIALTAGGVIQMLSPQVPGLKQSSAPENAASYAFGSAKNTTASGNIIPICIGHRAWGGVIISASIYAEDRA
ncbi:tail assembly protein [Pseudomonas shahriarae]|uniref:Tail assembly protein n=1 Tax=Pseudomonas shahriarae TaxID=2745512 RepID=A0ABT5NA04_9PSED|nr:tail assembly protein [Pseudomonas shahriarae]MDD0985367.1 tail assembly protein [Pseudomonas shahriarae]MDD1033437.1 tail assembly protein [Pseudomonas shahriarae]